ncbi:MAG: surface-adhesin E family protein [Caulobacterales bacterium]
MKRVLVALALVLAAGGPAAAAAPVGAAAPIAGPDYWRIGASSDRTLYVYVDAATITDRAGLRSAQLTLIGEGAGDNARDGKWEATLVYFNCHTHEHAVKSGTYHRADGAVLRSFSFDRLSWQAPAPGSLGAIEERFVCADRTQWGPAMGFTQAAPDDLIQATDVLYRAERHDPAR